MDVVGFGALNLDKLYSVDRIAKEGEHVQIRDVREASGGSAANTIAGLARLGLRAGFVGAVGNDAEGRKILLDFNTGGVDTRGIVRINEGTGIIIGFVDRNGERTLYPYPGANNKLGIHDINFNYIKDTRILHLSSFVGERQFGIQKRAVKKLPKDIRVSFSPGLYAEKKLKELLPIIKRCYVLFLNEDEIGNLTNKDYKKGSKELIENGAGIVAVTLGKRGCYIRDLEDAYEIPAYKTIAVDTTGAGDAFAAGFLYGSLSGKDIKDSGRLGNYAASCCIRKFGARDGLPYRKEIRDRLKKWHVKKKRQSMK